MNTKKISTIGSILICAGLTACVSNVDTRSRFNDDGRVQATRTLSPNPSGEVIGNGPVRASLLIPSSIPGGAAQAALELRNGAEMAVNDFGQGKLQIVVKDTRGQAAEAQGKAAEAVTEGSSIILGPLFAANVSAAAGVTIPAKIPMIAYSTDTSVARRDTYLFSFTPQSDTARIVNYAGTIGRRNMAVFVPKNAEGALRTRIIREQSFASGVQATIIEYERTPTGIGEVLASSVDMVKAADSIYIPEGGPIPNLILTGLQQNGVQLNTMQIFGSGSWESVKLNDRVLEGAIYPGRDISTFNEFAERYQASYGTYPGVQAALAYDSVLLLTQLIGTHGPRNAFTSRNIELKSGFRGKTGSFRFMKDGSVQRTLAIYQVRGGQGNLLEPAGNNFTGRGF